MPERRTYSVGEAAAILGISRSLAYECIKTGEIPAVRFRRRIVVPAHVLDELTSVTVHRHDASWAAGVEGKEDGPDDDRGGRR